MLKWPRHLPLITMCERTKKKKILKKKKNIEIHNRPLPVLHHKMCLFLRTTNLFHSFLFFSIFALSFPHHIHSPPFRLMSLVCSGYVHNLQTTKRKTFQLWNRNTEWNNHQIQNNTTVHSFFWWKPYNKNSKQTKWPKWRTWSEARSKTMNMKKAI